MKYLIIVIGIILFINFLYVFASLCIESIDKIMEKLEILEESKND